MCHRNDRMHTRRAWATCKACIWMGHMQGMYCKLIKLKNVVFMTYMYTIHTWVLRISHARHVYILNTTWMVILYARTMAWLAALFGSAQDTQHGHAHDHRMFLPRHVWDEAKQSLLYACLFACIYTWRCVFPFCLRSTWRKGGGNGTSKSLHVCMVANQYKVMMNLLINVVWLHV